MIEVIVKYNGDISKVAKDLGLEIEILSPNYALITLKRADVTSLYKYSEVEYLEPAKKLSYLLEKELSASCIRAVQEEAYGLQGEGVLVAIIDSGVDFKHPDFINDDGTSRILSIWDQSIEGKAPQGFNHGTEYTNEDLNKALKGEMNIPEIDTLGHGTAVAGIAAGNGGSSNGREKGVAPKASLIVVKLKGHTDALTTEVMRGIKYALDKAQELKMPLVINLSFGTNNGSHDGSSLFETYIDDMSNIWKTSIVVASGNEASAGHHYHGLLKDNENLDVSLAIGNNLKQLYITLWKHFSDEFILELITPSGVSGGTISKDNFLTENTIDNITIKSFYGEPTHYNEDQEVYFMIEAQEGFIPIGIWIIRIKAGDIVIGDFSIWLPTVEEVTNQTAFSSPTEVTTLTLPSTANKVITVGGYDAGVDSISSFSGQGYTRNNVYVKPDLVAPSVNVISTKRNGGYDAFTGTSMAAPFVTGSVALMMEWGIVLGNDLFLYGQRVKAFLRKGTNKKADVIYPNQLWGYGSLCLLKTMDYLVNYERSIQNE